MFVDTRTREAEFIAARTARDSARSQLAPWRICLAELKASETAALHALAEYRGLYKQQQFHADVAMRKNQRRKWRQKIARRDRFGDAARTADEELRTIRQNIDNVKTTLRLRSLQCGLFELNDRYAIARHEWLREISEEETSHDRSVKLGHAIAASVPAQHRVEPAAVWMYQIDNPVSGVIEVHLFYGGGRAPTGVGNSPDGWGHGHHVLEMDAAGKTSVAFIRYADQGRYAAKTHK